MYPFLSWWYAQAVLYKGLGRVEFMTMLRDRGLSYEQAHKVYHYHIAECNWYQRHVWWRALERNDVSKLEALLKGAAHA